MPHTAVGFVLSPRLVALPSSSSPAARSYHRHSFVSTNPRIPPPHGRLHSRTSRSSSSPSPRSSAQIASTLASPTASLQANGEPLELPSRPALTRPLPSPQASSPSNHATDDYLQCICPTTYLLAYLNCVPSCGTGVALEVDDFFRDECAPYGGGASPVPYARPFVCPDAFAQRGPPQPSPSAYATRAAAPYTQSATASTSRTSRPAPRACRTISPSSSVCSVRLPSPARALIPEHSRCGWCRLDFSFRFLPVHRWSHVEGAPGPCRSLFLAGLLSNF